MFAMSAGMQRAMINSLVHAIRLQSAKVRAMTEFWQTHFLAGYQQRSCMMLRQTSEGL
jgi:hypothetical protein